MGCRSNKAADYLAEKRANSWKLDKKTPKTHETTTLAHINPLVTEQCNQVTREWIQDKVAGSSVYKLKRKLGMRDAFNPKAKRKTEGGITTTTKKDTLVFFQMASEHTLIGTHLK